MCELGDILGIVKIMIVVMRYLRVPGSDIRFGEKKKQTKKEVHCFLLTCLGLACYCEEAVGVLNLVLERLLTSRQVRNEIAELSDFK